MNTLIERDIEDIAEIDEDTEKTVEGAVKFPDTLNRTYFVNQVIRIIENLSAKKEPMCYAIKGAWGVGKTHVLNMLEQELLSESRDAEAYEKYVILHYNAWEYDYYDEPLAAIIAAMLNELKDTNSLIPTKVKKKLLSTITPIGLLMGLLEKAKNMERSCFTELLKSKDQTIDSTHSSNHNLRETMERLKEGLKNEAKNATIILIVDELDRCLPEYSIKVLERIHHIFHNTPNIQVILSVDYNQLENTVETIFGEKVSTKQYLSKFINFGIELSEGNLDENFDKQFDYYVKHFDYNYANIAQDDIKKFKSFILDGVDMRRRIETINKCNLLHTLLWADTEKADYSIMCIEIVLTLLKSYYTDSTLRLGYPAIFDSYKDLPSGLKTLGSIYSNAVSQKTHNYISYDYGNKRHYVNIPNLWGVVLATLRKINGANEDPISGRDCNIYEIFDYCETYWEYLKLVN